MTGPATGRILESDDISALFGIEMAQSETGPNASVDEASPAKPARSLKKRAKASAPVLISSPRPAPGKPEPKQVPVRPKAAKRVCELTADGFVKWWK